MGFRDDIDAITQALKPSPERQTFMFSATVSRSVQQVARATLAKNHEFINCVSEDDSPVHDHVTQYHTVVPKADQQLPHVLRLLAHDQLTNPAKSKVIVFLPTTRMVQLFTTFMRELADDVLPSGRNSNIYEIHSKRTQEARTNTSDRFRNDKSGSAVLVTSDVSARGVDYPGVTRVIQVGIPQSTEQYIHRVGRTGRGGATGGRGDLVLLPWEVGFVTWQLTDVPLKPLTTESLREQVTTLAEKFDKDPQAFFAGTPASAAPRFDKRGRHNNDAPAIFKAPFMPKLLEQEAAVRDLLTQADEEAIKETMASMLGYYISKSPELRVQKSVIVEGLRQWTVEACGLPTPPYVSDTFLARLGMSDNRTKHFGRGPSRDYNKTARRDGEPSWMRRGNQGKPMRRDDGERPEYSRPARLEEGDPRSAPEEYRTPRFNRDGPRSFSSDRGPSRRDNDDRGSRDFGGRSRDFSDRGSSRRNDY
jgi:ATP-dependent RNA helicase MSS116